MQATDRLTVNCGLLTSTSSMSVAPFGASIVAGSSASMVNAAVEGFARAAAVELPRGLRINAVSPTVFEESMGSYHETSRYFFVPRIEKPPNVFGQNHVLYRNWQMNQPLFDGRGRWLRLTKDEKQLIKDKAGEMLIKYGYVTDFNW